MGDSEQRFPVDPALVDQAIRTGKAEAEAIVALSRAVIEIEEVIEAVVRALPGEDAERLDKQLGTARIEIARALAFIVSRFGAPEARGADRG